MYCDLTKFPVFVNKQHPAYRLNLRWDN